jgi:WD40 repeat protein
LDPVTNRTIRLDALLRDAQRFVQEFHVPIATSALHIYVSALSFTPHGTALYAVYSTEPRHLVNVAVGTEATWTSCLRTFEGHTGPVNTIAFSPDSRRIASGSSDMTIRLWDITTGNPIGEPWIGHQGDVTSIAFSPDGKRVVSAAGDSTIRFWDPRSGRCLVAPMVQFPRSSDGFPKFSAAVAFSPDGKQVASDFGDGALRLFDAVTGHLKHASLVGSGQQISSICFSPDGNYIVSGSNADFTIRLWNAATGAPSGEPSVYCGTNVNSVAFSPDGSHIIFACHLQTVYRCDLHRGISPQRPFADQSPKPIRLVAYSPDGKYVVSDEGYNDLVIWDAHARALVGNALKGHTDTVSCLAYSPDGKNIASGAMDHSVRLWDSTRNTTQRDPSEGAENSRISKITFSPDGESFAYQRSTTMDGWDVLLCLWNAATCTIAARTPARYSNTFYGLRFSPDGKLIACGSFDSGPRLWNAKTLAAIGELPQTPIPPPGSDGFRLSGFRLAGVMEFSPDSRYLAHTDGGSVVYIHDLKTDAMFGYPFTCHAEVDHLAFSNDAKRLIIASRDGIVRCWDIAARIVVGTPIDYKDMLTVGVMTFSGDDARVIFRPCREFQGFDLRYAGDPKIHIWDIESGRSVAAIPINPTTNFPLSKEHQAALRDAFVDVTKFFAMSVDGWLFRFTERGRLCWIPQANRGIFAIHPSGSKFVMGSGSGRITVIELPNPI